MHSKLGHITRGEMLPSSLSNMCLHRDAGPRVTKTCIALEWFTWIITHETFASITDLSWRQCAMTHVAGCSQLNLSENGQLGSLLFIEIILSLFIENNIESRRQFMYNWYSSIRNPCNSVKVNSSLRVEAFLHSAYFGLCIRGPNMPSYSAKIISAT